MEEIGFYRLNDVLKIIPICKSAWFSGIRKGLYPKPKKHGKSSLWVKTEIHNLVRTIEREKEIIKREKEISDNTQE